MKLGFLLQKMGGKCLRFHRGVPSRGTPPIPLCPMHGVIMMII